MSGYARSMMIAVSGAFLVGSATILGWLRSRDAAKESVQQMIRKSCTRPLVANDVFTYSMLSELPAPVQKFLRRSVQEGVPLYRSARVEMKGFMKTSPNGSPMPFDSMLYTAFPPSFCWIATVGKGNVLAPRMSGFDCYDFDSKRGEMRWWLWNWLPIVNQQNENVTRSAAGRAAMEMSAFLPTVLTPALGNVEWESIDDHSAKLRVPVHAEATVEMVYEFTHEGAVKRIVCTRWCDDAEGHKPGFAPFVVELSGEIIKNGIRVPREIVAGWHVPNREPFMFFDASVEDITYTA
eukprot:ANDGO_03580.mRNA.1 hypothetical protein